MAIIPYKTISKPDSKAQTSPIWHRTMRPVRVDQRAVPPPYDGFYQRPRFTEQWVKGAVSHGHGTSENSGPHVSCRCRNYFLALAYCHVLWDVAACGDVYWVPSRTKPKKEFDWTYPQLVKFYCTVKKLKRKKPICVSAFTPRAFGKVHITLLIRTERVRV